VSPDLCAATRAYAGLRISEALGLRWRDLDLKAGTLTVAGQVGADGARRSAWPPRWTDVASAPGVLFLYPHGRSDVCLVKRGDTIVTVLSRGACRCARNESNSGPPL
jgi:hypothetical protein